MAAVKIGDLLKVDIVGDFLCADMDENEEVFMFLDNMMSEMCIRWMPELKSYLRPDGKLIVRVNKAMYSLIQLAKLWFNELSRHLEQLGFKKCPSDECVLVHRTTGGKYIIILLNVDDILIMAESREDRHWIKDLLQAKYKKVMYDEGKRLPYLGMTILKTENGFEIAMQSYIKDILKFYGKSVKDYVVPGSHNLFTIIEHEEPILERAKFHSVVAKLLYLGKRGRPDILLKLQMIILIAPNYIGRDNTPVTVPRLAVG